MTPLREQLESARDEYRSLTYDGDVVSHPDLRGRFRSTLSLGSLATGALAAAAVLAVVLARPLLNPPPANPHDGYLPWVKEIEWPQSLRMNLRSMTGMPNHMTLRQIAPSLMPDHPMHMPSLDDLPVPLLSAGANFI